MFEVFIRSLGTIRLGSLVVRPCECRAVFVRPVKARSTDFDGYLAGTSPKTELRQSLCRPDFAISDSIFFFSVGHIVRVIIKVRPRVNRSGPDVGPAGEKAGERPPPSSSRT